MRAGGRIPVLGRRARQITRIGSLFREAGTKLGESLFTREGGVAEVVGIRLA
jgi:hypothetical protein